MSFKAFDLLLELIERRPDAAATESGFSRNRSRPGTFVVEANLSNLIADIRAALEDDVRHPRFIRTVHGFRYAFCGAVSDDPAGSTWRRGCALRARPERRYYPLAEGENVLGREGNTASWFDSTSVSRRHARIVVTDGKALLEDTRESRTERSRRRARERPVALEDGAGDPGSGRCSSRSGGRCRSRRPRVTPGFRMKLLFEMLWLPPAGDQRPGACQPQRFARASPLHSNG